MVIIEEKNCLTTFLHAIYVDIVDEVIFKISYIYNLTIFVYLSPLAIFETISL